MRIMLLNTKNAAEYTRVRLRSRLLVTLLFKSMFKVFLVRNASVDTWLFTAANDIVSFLKEIFLCRSLSSLIFKKVKVELRDYS